MSNLLMKFLAELLIRLGMVLVAVLASTGLFSPGLLDEAGEFLTSSAAGWALTLLGTVGPLIWLFRDWIIQRASLLIGLASHPETTPEDHAAAMKGASLPDLLNTIVQGRAKPDNHTLRAIALPALILLGALGLAGCEKKDTATAIAIRMANFYALTEGSYTAVSGLREMGVISADPRDVNREFLRILDAMDALGVAIRAGQGSDDKAKVVIDLVRDFNQSNVLGIGDESTRRALSEWLTVAEIWATNIRLLANKKKPTAPVSEPVRAQMDRASRASRGISPGTIAYLSSLFGQVMIQVRNQYDLDQAGAWAEVARIGERLRAQMMR